MPRHELHWFTKQDTGCVEATNGEVWRIVSIEIDGQILDCKHTPIEIDAELFKKGDPTGSIELVSLQANAEGLYPKERYIFKILSGFSDEYFHYGVVQVEACSVTKKVIAHLSHRRTPGPIKRTRKKRKPDSEKRNQLASTDETPNDAEPIFKTRKKSKKKKRRELKAPVVAPTPSAFSADAPQIPLSSAQPARRTPQDLEQDETNDEAWRLHFEEKLNAHPQLKTRKILGLVAGFVGLCNKRGISETIAFLGNLLGGGPNVEQGVFLGFQKAVANLAARAPTDEQPSETPIVSLPPALPLPFLTDYDEAWRLHFEEKLNDADSQFKTREILGLVAGFIGLCNEWSISRTMAFLNYLLKDAPIEEQGVFSGFQKAAVNLLTNTQQLGVLDAAEARLENSPQMTQGFFARRASTPPVDGEKTPFSAAVK